MQLPRRTQVDQFHGYPAMDSSALSMASSRRLKPERKSAFLEWIISYVILSITHISGAQKEQPWIGCVFYLLKQVKQRRIER